MKTKLVKDLMVPLSAYATVPEDATLSDAVAALEESHAKCSFLHNLALSDRAIYFILLR